MIDFQPSACYLSVNQGILRSSSVGCKVSSPESYLHRVFVYASRGYVSVGCYSVNLSPLMPESSSATTVENCVNAAANNGYSIAALNTQGTCSGGNNLELAVENPVADGCGLHGQSSSSFQVFANTEVVYTSLGYYQDLAVLPIANNFIASEGSAIYDAPSCAAMAVVQFNLLFGLSSSGSVCFVGNEVATVLALAYLPVSNVNEQTVHLYVRTISPTLASSPQSTYQNIGCYIDFIGSFAKTIPNYQSSKSDPATCAQYAEEAQEVIFGLQNGGDCRTGNSLASAISLGSITGCSIYGAATANQVFVRQFCFPGSTTVSSYSGNVLTFGCRPCLVGHYCPGNNTEIPCPIDYSTNGYVGFEACDPCDTVGQIGQASCTHIPEGYYIKNNTLFFCGNNTHTQHYIGGGYEKSLCRCAAGFSGDQCDIPSCGGLLTSGVLGYGASLGSLLFNSDPTLSQASISFASSDFDTSTVRTYLLNLLTVDLNINGDGQLSTTEMITYLESRSFFRRVWSCSHFGAVLVCATTTFIRLTKCIPKQCNTTFIHQNTSLTAQD